MSKHHSTGSSSIGIVGADANNLKNIDVDFPLKQISVVTGVSGSGKSSLLANTLAGEGSRRMRTFLGMSQQELERDDVLAFIGKLPPTILVGQRGFRPNVRTTVGTATGFLAVLRRLFVLESRPYSERAKSDVPAPSAGSYAGWIARHYRDTVEVWAAPVRQQRTDGVAAVKRLAANGVDQVIVRSDTDPPRLRESGREVATSKFGGLNPNVLHTIEAMVGAVDVGDPSQRKRLLEILERGFAAGNGAVVVSLPSAADAGLAGPYGPRLDSHKHWVHPDDPAVFARPSAHLLSFNAPEHADSGACRACRGTGIGRRLREAVLIAHPERSMNQGALAIWTDKNYKYVHIQHDTVEGLRGMRGFSPDVPWSKLSTASRELVLNGSGDELVFDRDHSGRKYGSARPFPGFGTVILDKASGGTKIAEHLSAYVETGTCETCGGTRWSFQARALRVAGRGIGEILAMPLSDVERFAAASGAFERAVPAESRGLVDTIRRHAHSIHSVGLGYLSADRGMLDVSEGESRRIRLARVLDARESGLCLLLDEPARGLHESDLSRLAVALRRLRGDHTVILNEHREGLWDAADWLVEVGPGAGASGGEVTYAGSPAQRPGAEDDALLRAPMPTSPKHPRIGIRGASINNVDNVDCEIPIGRMTCISGVSGSGKSSFIRGVLAPALLEALGGVASDCELRRGRWRSVTGAQGVGELVALDQIMPQPNRRSLVATFTDVFDEVRRVFAASADAKRDGLTAADFGVNGGEGRCDICAGVGELSDGDRWSLCPSCGGSRYGHRALSARVGGLNVQELLETPVERLRPHAEIFRIPPPLIEAMCELGIGYVAIGRRIDTLSGGEVQRLRLAMRLGAQSAGRMFFILDEPAVGLHVRDVRRLAGALDRVLDGGRNTLVMVEHDLRLIRAADWAIEFGPGSGPDGGQIIFSGTPDELLRRKTPTGLALAGRLSAPQVPGRTEAPSLAERTLPVSEQIARTTALLRTLISGDAGGVAGPEDGSAEPVVAVTERFWSGREPWEVAGLDHEIPKLLLDVQQTTKGEVFEGVLAEWRGDPSCWLAVQPFLSDMQTWGAELPESVIRAVTTHLSKERLRLVTVKGEKVPKAFDPRSVRATGDRLLPEGNREEARLCVLRDAFAIGARYVELRDSKGRLRATATDRLLEMESAIVAPMALVPTHFSRLDPQGRCPMCEGRRTVTTLPDSLVIANRKAPPDSERFLTPEANAVMKGIRHNELGPFLRRLTKEGLWDPGASFERLDAQKQNLILFGFWSRPGAGSFLKSGSANPAEVSSWLRWDGLYRHVLDQSQRSRSDVWSRSVREGKGALLCPRCDGSGLQLYARLLRTGGKAFDAWVRQSDPAKRLDGLRAVDAKTPRQRKTLQRILQCLTPLARPRDSAAAVVREAVNTFTTMAVADGSVAEES